MNDPANSTGSILLEVTEGTPRLVLHNHNNGKGGSIILIASEDRGVVKISTIDRRTSVDEGIVLGVLPDGSGM